VQNDQRGIYMFGSAAGNTITNNTIRDNAIGIQLWISGEQPTPYINWGGETPTSPKVHCNNIYNNSSYGAISTNIQGTPMIMDAENNWWGHASGPSGEGFGSGDAVSTNVDFTPWLIGLWEVTPPCGIPPDLPPPGLEYGAAVGIEVYPVDKIGLIAPWIALAVVIIAGGVVLLMRRRAHS